MVRKRPTGEYSSNSIRLLTGLDQVRAHPTMYIGSVDEAGLFLILRELLDNAVDEFSAGRASRVQVHVGKNGENWVHDDGTGVPQGTKTTVVSVDGKDVKSKIPTMQAVFGNLHTSGKHSDAYGASVGVHGVGVKSTNALSTSFKVWTYYKKVWYHLAFEKGAVVSKGVVKEAPPEANPFGKLRKGTLIQYMPDFSIFSAKAFLATDLQTWCEFTAYLNPGFKIKVESETNDGVNGEFYSKRGPADYLDKRIGDLGVTQLHEGVFEYKDDLSDVVVAFTDYDGCDLLGFTTGLHNVEGGRHVNSVVSALFNAAKAHALKRHKFTIAEFREGLVGIVNAKLSNAKFSSQAKVRLTDERMGTEFEKSVMGAAQKFFKKTPALARLLCERASKLEQLKNQFRASKKVVQELNKVKRQGMPAKYAPYRPGTKLEDRELYIVEGDSAGGCFLGSTEVMLSDGSVKTFSQLAYDFQQGIDNEGIAYDRTNGRPEPFVIDHPRITKHVKELVVVEFEDGSEVTCTPDHRFLLESGVYKAAEYLTDEDMVRKNTTYPGVPRKVRKITVDEPVPVYDLTSPKYHNFTLANGVVVHNSAKQGRFPYQAILPLKGKIMNAGKNGQRVLESEEVIHILSAIGFDPKLDDPYSRLQVSKIICMSDPDPDGYHINVLLLTLFYKFLPRLFDLGMIYVADTPEFYSELKDGTIVSGKSLSEVQKALKGAGASKNAVINHIKGYGEIGASLVRQMALDPSTRNLIQLKTGTKEEMSMFDRLMNEDVQFRREHLLKIEEH